MLHTIFFFQTSNILGMPISNLVRFVDIGGIGDHHYLNFLFIINIWAFQLNRSVPYFFKTQRCFYPKTIFHLIIYHNKIKEENNPFVIKGLSWSWLYDSWIYNYLSNQHLSLLKLWVWIPLMARCTRYSIMWYNLSVTV